MANHLSGDAWAFGTPHRPRRHGRRASLVAMLATLSLILGAAAAFADNLTVDSLEAGSVTNPTIDEGDGFSTTINYRVQETGANNTSFPATVNFALSSGAPSWVSLSTNSLVFTDYTSTKSLTVSGTAPAGSAGIHSFSVTPSTSAPRLTVAPATVNMSVTVNAPAPIDSTPPTINCDVPDDTIWYDDDVSVNCTASDASGLENATDAEFTLSTNVDPDDETASASTGSREVCDVHANCATAGPYTFKVDRKAPVITCDSPSPVFLLHASPAQVTGSATDAGSGPGSQDLSAAADTSSVGAETAQLSASDNVGNESTKDCAYSVVYDWDGFFRPIDNGGVFNSLKAGQAVPVKFSLAGDQGLSILAAGSPSSRKVACDNTAEFDPVESTVTAGNSSLSYDATADQYVYVWKTEKSWAGTCRELTVSLIDGTSHTALFKLLK
jgi:hypothetical protein